MPPVLQDHLETRVQEMSEQQVQEHPGREADRAALVRQHGLRATASRVAVLRLLEGAMSPMSHQEVCEALADAPWNRSTLYRNLLDLTDVGLLARTEIGGIMRFQREGARNACTDHPHFVCSECGDVAHLDGVVVTVAPEPGAEGPSALREGAVEIQLRGLCDLCL